MAYDEEAYEKRRQNPKLSCTVIKQPASGNQNRMEAGRPLADLLQDMLVGIEPAINKSAGSSGYQQELVDTIKDACSVGPREIHINDVCQNVAEYATLIAEVLGE